MPTQLCDSLLLKTSRAYPPGSVARWHETLADTPWAQARVQSVATAKAENGQPMHHTYLHLPQATELDSAYCLAFEKRWHALTGHTAQVSRLREALRCEGASFGETPGVHYVVETDTDEGWETEIFRWYDEEHMPGLATVPGCILARRLLNLDHGPRSFASYDLVNRETLGSPAWLAVRGTAWSDKCRPHFVHTLRTMFENPNA
ncbi:hypothetical protein [Limnohabitans sp.]|uniref:hypothetical protein n=1 Tax=Limnohabitans sp. TaxID=1907725 RepID=UPI0038B9A276